MILVLVEHSGGRPDRLSLEALTLARRIAGASAAPVHAVLVGPGARDAAAALGGQGIAVAHVVEDPRLESYAPVGWAASVAQLMDGAPAVIAAGSDRGNEVMAHVAARSDLPMAANVTDVQAGTPVRVVRQRWAGSLLEDAEIVGDRAVITVAPHAVPIEEAAGAAPAIEAFTPQLDEKDLRVRVVGRVEAEKGRISLADARVVVGGGRGVGGPEAFAVLEELAGLLGAAVGVSRVATSAGWRPHSDQIGQTGLRIAPDLYIACGISGAIQHIVGCKAAKRILVINKDADAPIMGRAAYAVIGDLHTVVPAISEEIRRVRANGAATKG
ncbi:MAG TPA: electron transfer flavoprotein subunit alpha/FixB family protein [Candidatus Limnocylindrales bacterium]|nr:electron transfer flavoprotein subunit alpha/FixB family protein [Candidatus Limnocylindrales bacterium]